MLTNKLAVLCLFEIQNMCSLQVRDGLTLYQFYSHNRPKKYLQIDIWNRVSVWPLAEVPSRHLMRSLEHLHQEGVDRRVANQLEEEKVLQAFESN